MIEKTQIKITEKTANLFGPGDYYAEYATSLDGIRYLKSVWEVDSVTLHKCSMICLHLKEIDFTKRPYVLFDDIHAELTGNTADWMFPENQFLHSPSKDQVFALIERNHYAR